jgi:hypothetical protein
MAVYSYGQLEQLWIDAGGPKALAPLMAAIALAESGGNPANNNYNDPKGDGTTQTSWGLWQISNGTHSAPVANINDPLVNAKQAVAKYNSQGLSAWTTYTGGAYKQYYQGKTPAASLPRGGNPGGSSTQDADLTAWGPNIPSWALPALGPAGLVAGAVEDVGGLISAAPKIASTGAALGGIFQAMTGIAADLNAALAGIEWLFYPSHWVRIYCFWCGLVLGLFGLRSLSRASDGGTSLATGILLVTLSGMFLFLAFHNLPDDVKDLQGLLGYISNGIRTRSGQDTTQPAGVSPPQ